MSSGTTALSGHTRPRNLRLSLDVAWVACDHPGCDETVAAAGSAPDAVLSVAEAEGWLLGDHADYCEPHAAEHEDDEGADEGTDD